jgi:hypothetical protein
MCRPTRASSRNSSKTSKAACRGDDARD